MKVPAHKGSRPESAVVRVGEVSWMIRGELGHCWVDRDWIRPAWLDDLSQLLALA